MTAVGNNSLNTRATLNAAGKTYAFTPSRKPPPPHPGLDPGSAISPAALLMKVLLESPLRFEDGKTVTRAH